MDLDSAALWYATRSEATFKEARDLGIGTMLFTGLFRSAWDFVETFKKEHGEMPGLGIVVEQTGAPIRPPEEEEQATLSYIADQLWSRYEYRCLQHGLHTSLEKLEEGEQSDSVSEVHRLSNALKNAKAQHVRLSTLADSAPKVQELYDRTKRGEIGVPFPWEAMNAMTLGMWPGTLTFFAARPGTGKTWVALIIALYVWSVSKIKVLVVSPEMNEVELAERCVSKVGELPYGDLVGGSLGQFGEPSLKETIEKLKETGNHFYILDDEERLEADLIEQTIDAVEPGLVVFDSVYMLRVIEEKKGNRSARQDRFVDTLDWMRRLSRRKQVPILGISQLSRDGKVRKNDSVSVKRGKATGGLENAIAFSDALLQDCVPKGSLVYTPRGAVPIESLVDGGEVVVGDVTATARSWRTGPKKVLTLELFSGFELRASQDHKILSMTGEGAVSWVRSGDLRHGDWVIRQRVASGGSVDLRGFDGDRQHNNEAQVVYPQSWTEELAELIGYTVGDGCVRASNRVTWAIDPRDPEIAKWITEQLAAFGLNARHKPRSSNERQTCDIVDVCSVGFVRWLRWLGMRPDLSYEKRVPQRIWEAPRNVRLAFVRGLMEADGCITKNGQLTLTSTSYDLAMGATELLRMGGFNPTVRRYSYDGTRDSLRVWLGREETQRWMGSVGLRSVRKAAQLLVDRNKTPGRWSTTTVYPEHHDFVLEQVRGSRVGGEEEMWDITVDHEDHRFLCHGVVVHNCHNLFALFQDIDMKMDKQLMFVPLKARRQARASHVVIRWDMESMKFEQIGTRVDSTQRPSKKDTGDDDKDFADVPY